MEVWPTGPQRLAKHVVLVGDVVHACVPRLVAVVAAHGPVAERALYGARGLFAAEVAQAVGMPDGFVGEDVRAREEPKGALEYRRADLCPRQFQHPIVVLEQRHPGEVAGQARADGGFGDGRIGSREAGAEGRRVRGRLVNEGWCHGRCAALDGGRPRVLARSETRGIGLQAFKNGLVKTRQLQYRLVKVHQAAVDVRRLHPRPGREGHAGGV